MHCTPQPPAVGTYKLLYSCLPASALLCVDWLCTNRIDAGAASCSHVSLSSVVVYFLSGVFYATILFIFLPAASSDFFLSSGGDRSFFGPLESQFPSSVLGDIMSTTNCAVAGRAYFADAAGRRRSFEVSGEDWSEFVTEVRGVFS